MYLNYRNYVGENQCNTSTIQQRWMNEQFEDGNS